MNILNSGRFGMAAGAAGGLRRLISKCLPWVPDSLKEDTSESGTQGSKCFTSIKSNMKFLWKLVNIFQKFCSFVGLKFF